MRKLVLLTPLLLSALWLPAQTGELLRIRLEAGDTFFYRLTIDQKTELESNGDTQIRNQDFLYEIVVEDKMLPENSSRTFNAFRDTAVYKLKYYYSSVRVETNSGIYDSDSLEVGLPLDLIAFKGLVGASFTVHMNDRGDILEVSGMEAMIDSMVAAYRGRIPDHLIASIRKSVRGNFNSNSMKRMLSEATLAFPEGLVNDGQQWEHRAQFEVPIPMQVDSRFSVVSMDKGEIRQVNTVSTDPEKRIELPGDRGLEAAYALSGTGSARIFLDQSTHLSRSVSNRLTVAGPMTVYLPGKEPFTTQVSILTVTRMELVD